MLINHKNALIYPCYHAIELVQAIQVHFYFVRSGLISLNDGTLRILGFDGYYPSNTTNNYSSPTDAKAYLLGIYPAGIDPSNNSGARWFGIPVRCLVYKLLLYDISKIKNNLHNYINSYTIKHVFNSGVMQQVHCKKGSIGEKLMKKFCFRNIVATALAVVISASVSIPTFAAEAIPGINQDQPVIIEVEAEASNNADNGEIAPQAVAALFPMTAASTSSYTRIINDPDGLPGNFTITIKPHSVDNKPGTAYNDSRYRGDIMMYGPNGLVWQEQDCMEGRNNRTFLCGPGVTSVWFRIVSRGHYTETFNVAVEY